MNDLLIPKIEIEVLPSSLSHEKSYIQIFNDKRKYFVGDNIQLKMICFDKYENKPFYVFYYLLFKSIIIYSLRI